MDDEVTTQEVAALKGVSRAAVHKAIVDGRLPARWQEASASTRWKIARPAAASARGKWYIRRSDVERWQPAKTPSERGIRSGLARKKGESVDESE